MGVSENSGTPKSSILICRVFHYKPSILGAHPYFRKHPYCNGAELKASVSYAISLECLKTKLTFMALGFLEFG